MTKQDKSIVERYRNSTATRLSEVYSSYSKEKESSYNAIIDEMVSLGGHTLRILGANSSAYSCAYQLDDTLVYHTAWNRRVIKLV